MLARPSAGMRSEPDFEIRRMPGPGGFGITAADYHHEIPVSVVEQLTQESLFAMPAALDSSMSAAATQHANPVRAGIVIFFAAIAFGIATIPQPLRFQSTASSDPPEVAARVAEPAVRTADNESALHEKPSAAGSIAAGETPSVNALVEKVRAGLPVRDLVVTVALDPPQSSFVEGEMVSIGFSTEEEAYVMVLVYSTNDSVTMLYPNDYAEREKVEPGVVNWVGADRKFVVKVVPLFGRDTIHVVAFRNADDRKFLLDMLAVRKNSREIFSIERSSLERSIAAIRLRGLAVEKRGSGAAAVPKSGWGDAVTTISTYSRMD